MPNNNDDSLLALLNIVRNDQELYMKHQWQVVYFTFLLYAAIIYIFDRIGDAGSYFFILSGFVFVLVVLSCLSICKLDSSIKDHQDMAKKIYNEFPRMRDIIPKQPLKKSLSFISIVLVVTVIIGAVISIMFMAIEKDKVFLQRIDKLEQKIDRYISTLEEIKSGNNIDYTIERKINTLNDRLSKRIDQLGERIDGIGTANQLPKNDKSKGK